MLLEFRLEVGFVIDHRKKFLQEAPNISVFHVRKQVNEVAHMLAKIPCPVNCFIVFTSPAALLVKTLLFDIA